MPKDLRELCSFKITFVRFTDKLRQENSVYTSPIITFRPFTTDKHSPYSKEESRRENKRKNEE